MYNKRRTFSLLSFQKTLYQTFLRSRRPFVFAINAILKISPFFRQWCKFAVTATEITMPFNRSFEEFFAFHRFSMQLVSWETGILFKNKMHWNSEQLLSVQNDAHLCINFEAFDKVLKKKSNYVKRKNI